MRRNSFDYEKNPVKKSNRFRSSPKCVVGVIISVIVLVIISVCAVVLTIGISNPSDNPEYDVPSYNFSFVSRAGWNARAPRDTLRLPTPVPFVIIHHSFLPGACYNNDQCIRAMRSMQNYHMDQQGWWDIGYSFAVGGSAAYEGRGWNRVGAHALHYNDVSIGICLIGDWSFSLPSAEDMLIVQKLIDVGLSHGFIRPDYKLIGHRQLNPTQCPGQALFEEIKNWTNFSPYPNLNKEQPL